MKKKLIIAAGLALMLGGCGASSSLPDEIKFLTDDDPENLAMYWKVEGESEDSSAVFNESCDAYQTEDSKDYCKKRNKIDDKLLDTVRDDLKDAEMTSVDTKDIDEGQLVYYFMDRKDNSNAVYFYRDGKIKCIGKDHKRTAYESETSDQILKACDDAVDQLNEADDAFVKEHFGNN